MQAPKSKYKKPAYLDAVQIIGTEVLDDKKDDLILILTNFISDKANRQTTITNLEQLSISIGKIVNSR
jgi:hypothetical protein